MPFVFNKPIPYEPKTDCTQKDALPQPRGSQRLSLVFAIFSVTVRAAIYLAQS